MNEILFYLFILVLAVFTGYLVIGRVPAMCQTPLMSGSNAISGVTVIGAILITGAETAPNISSVLGVIAIIVAMINVVGGFVVTDRMMSMFHK